MPTDEQLKQALRDCIDSLEYVNTSFPGLSGYGVRLERIEKAKKLLEEKV